MSTITAYSQKTLQNTVSIFNSKINIAYDTIPGEILFKSVDSVDVATTYNALITLCKALTGHDINRIVCQNTYKQTYTVFPRLLVSCDKLPDFIFDVNKLTSSQQDIYLKFINKLKIFL